MFMVKCRYTKRFVSFLALNMALVMFSVCDDGVTQSFSERTMLFGALNNIAMGLQNIGASLNVQQGRDASLSPLVSAREDSINQVLFENIYSAIAAGQPGESSADISARIRSRGKLKKYAVYVDGLLDRFNKLGGDFSKQAFLAAVRDGSFIVNVSTERKERAFSSERRLSLPEVSSDRKKQTPASVTDQSIYGQAALYGFMGKNNSWFYGQTNMKPTSFLQGIGAGAMYRLMAITGDELEEVVRREIAPACDSVVGGFIRSIKNTVRNAKCWLFNGGVRPYTLEQIGYWRNEVDKVILGKLAESAARAQKTQSDGAFGGRPRGQHTFDPLAMGDENGLRAEDTQNDATWMAMVDGLARDLNRITLGIEGPKLHYCGGDEKDEEVMQADGRADLLAIAQGIQDLLQLIKVHILLPSRSLKDLAVGDLKSILPSIKEMVDARFALFESMVSSYHGVTVKASKVAEAKLAKPARQGNSPYNDFAL